VFGKETTNEMHPDHSPRVRLACCAVLCSQFCFIKKSKALPSTVDFSEQDLLVSRLDWPDAMVC